MIEELIIDENNFHEYFFDIKKYRPKKGQIMARFAAAADFVDGPTKRDVIDILCNTPNGAMAVQLLKKLIGASENEARRISIEMARDLLSGMTVEEVANKPYRFVYEAFYWATASCVPKNDPHWSVITLVNLDQHVEKTAQI